MIAITRIVDRATPIDGIIAVRPRLNASFTYDHRVVQGVPGARFAERVKYYVEHPTNSSVPSRSVVRPQTYDLRSAD